LNFFTTFLNGIFLRELDYSKSRIIFFRSFFRLSLLAFSGFGGGKAAAETRKELRHAAQSRLG